MALEPHCSALRVYYFGENTALMIYPADLEAVHLGVLSGDGGTALYLQGTAVGSTAVRFCRQSGGDALRPVMAENMAPGSQRSPRPGGRLRATGRTSPMRRRCVEEQFPVGRTLHLPQPPSVPPVGPAAPPAAVAKPVPNAAPRPPPKKGLTHQYGKYANIRYMLR